MNLVELDRALRQLRLSGMAAVLETRLRHAQTEKLAPIDLVSMLVSDELLRRQDRLLERRHKLARFRDLHRPNGDAPVHRSLGAGLTAPSAASLVCCHGTRLSLLLALLAVDDFVVRQGLTLPSISAAFHNS